MGLCFTVNAVGSVATASVGCSANNTHDIEHLPSGCLTMSNVLNLERAIDEAIRKQPDEWDDTRIHASDLAVAIEDAGDKKCARQLWLRLHGAEKRERSPGQLLMLRHGTRIHEDMEELIREALPDGWSIAGREMAVEMLGITGRYDFELVGPDDQTVDVDIKTVRGNWFRYANTERPANVMQLRFYLSATGADYGILLYVDREGQNGCRQFVVERDDDAIVEAAGMAKCIAKMIPPPPVMPPNIKIQRNKGPDSVKVKLPWQCDYCDYLDVSCPGALEKADRHDGIVGKVHAEGFVVTDGIQFSAEVERAIIDQLEEAE